MWKFPPPKCLISIGTLQYIRVGHKILPLFIESQLQTAPLTSSQRSGLHQGLLSGGGSELSALGLCSKALGDLTVPAFLQRENENA